MNDCHITDILPYFNNVSLKGKLIVSSKVYDYFSGKITGKGKKGKNKIPFTPLQIQSCSFLLLSLILFPPAYLCARRGILPMSIWKSSWDSLAELRAGERSASRAKDSILWKMDTILQATKEQKLEH